MLGNEGGELPVAVKQKIGVSLTESGFSSQFTVEDVWHILAKMYPDFQKDFFDQKCDVLKLPRKKKLKEFSTGMKAKLRVLTAISHKADLLILDEPTAGLDPMSSTLIEDYIVRLKRETNAASIVVTHQMSTITRTADRVIMLYDGKIVFEGTPMQLLKQDTPYTRQFVTASLDGPMKLKA